MTSDAATHQKVERILKTDLTQYSKKSTRTDGPYAANLDIDCIIVGGGFGGIYSLHEMRKAGFSTVMYEAGDGYGGSFSTF